MNALLLRVLDRLVDRMVDHVGIHGILLGDRVRDQHTAGEMHIELCLERRGKLLRRIEAIVHGKAGLAGIERRQLIRAVANDRNALRLEIFKRKTEIQNGLRTRANDHYRRLRQLFQICGDVHGHFRAAMHAADTAGREHFDARHCRNDHRGRNGARAVHLLGNQHREIAAGRLGNLRAGFAEVFDFVCGQTRLQTTADDRNRRRNRAVVANDLLNVARGFHVLRIRHTVRNDRRFQCDDGLAFLQRLLNLGRNVQISVHVHEIHPPLMHLGNARKKP